MSKWYDLNKDPADLPISPTIGLLGTAEGIKQLAIMSKEEKLNDDKEQG